MMLSGYLEISINNYFLTLIIMQPHDVPESDPSPLAAPELSFGQKAVGLTFNPG